MRCSCAIAGGGPAGMMLGYLLARAGVDVIVLEKHADFLRDFRGDTIHPSTLEVMHQLGLADELLRLPHARAEQMGAGFGGKTYQIIDFRPLPVHHPFIAFMPQWDFLDFLAGKGRALPGFRLLMQAEVTGLAKAGDVVTGLTARTPEGEIAIEAALVVAADGRHSVLRRAAGMAVTDIGAPMDVLWFHLSRQPGDPGQSVGRVAQGGMFIMIERGDYWQCGYVIPKDGFGAVQAAGLPAFRERLLHFAPFLGERTQEIASFDDVKLLTVGVDRMPLWHRPGLLFIGDAAHTMSPIGGVGINLAVQDAVAAANRLAVPLRSGKVDDAALADVQERRAFPVRATQAAQVFIQNRMISAVLASRSDPAAPLLVRLLDRWPWLRRIPARLVGMGVRPELVDIDILED